MLAIATATISITTIIATFMRHAKWKDHSKFSRLHSLLESVGSIPAPISVVCISYTVRVYWIINYRHSGNSLGAMKFR